jgi:hypothetical protein
MDAPPLVEAVVANCGDAAVKHDGGNAYGWWSFCLEYPLLGALLCMLAYVVHRTCRPRAGKNQLSRQDSASMEEHTRQMRLFFNPLMPGMSKEVGKAKGVSGRPLPKARVTGMGGHTIGGYNMELPNKSKEEVVVATTGV